MPYRALLGLSKLVQADDEEDALRQVALCLDRDLEEIFAQVSAINVSSVRLEVHGLQPEPRPDGEALWNPEAFARQEQVPPHIELYRSPL